MVEQIIDSLAVVDDVTVESFKTKKQFTVQSMFVEADEYLARLLSIFSALPESISKRLTVDYYSLAVSRQKPLSLYSLLPVLGSDARSVSQTKKARLDAFSELGVRVDITNTPHSLLDQLLPLRGRSHLKGIERDGEVFYFGNVNLAKYIAEMDGFMVKFSGHRAGRLTEVLEQLNRDGSKRDGTVQLDQKLTLVLDAGKPGQSAIYKRALEAILDAQQSVLHLSQFMPSGEVARVEDESSKKGKQVEVVTAAPPMTSLLHLDLDSLVWLSYAKTVAQRFLYRYDSPVIFNSQRGIHSPLLILDGGKLAILGTHNLDMTGVKLGTREWAIFSEDRNLNQLLIDRYMGSRAEALNSC